MRLPFALVLMLGTSSPLAAQATQFVATSPPSLSWVGAPGAVLDDFDRDGAADLLVHGLWSSPYSLLHNDGLGGLTVNPLPMFAMVSGLAAAFVDFDGDGDRDLFLSWIGLPGSNVGLLRYMGGTQWLDASTSLPAMSAFNAMVVGDFDGDGDQDIAGVGHPIGMGAPGILTNNGGAFTWMQAFGGFQAIGAGDVDGDGDLDVAMTMPLQLWRNDGSMVFTNVSSAQLPPLPTYQACLVFGDVDGDGDQDLVIGDPINYVNQFDRLLRNDGSGTFVEVAGAIPLHPGAHTTSVQLVDVDEDGDLDLVRGGNPQPNLCVNDGAGTFTLAPGRLPPLQNVTALARAGDVDSDGDADIVLVTAGQPGMILWNRHRHVSVPAPPAIGQNWTVELWGQPGYGAGTRVAALGIGLFRFPQALVVPPLGALWLDVGGPFVLEPALIAPGAGAVPLVFPIPPAPSIIGVALHSQALIEETA
ncbi:MAG TPA: VCBS repeat-containing protein, partial [Planctomycetota bacterium]|nr:VCBS repeat-containing protein [Planctomycetota bacterium]